MGFGCESNMIPKMDYVVCTKNDELTISECLWSILGQKNLNRLIVVLSLKSKDRTIDLVNSLKALKLVDIIIEEDIESQEARETIKRHLTHMSLRIFGLKPLKE